MLLRTLGIVVVLLAFGTTIAQAADAPRPNVLWIIVDDLSADLGCYGNPIVQSPNIDRLATRGVRFDRAYVQYALCNPSRSSFLSGYGPDRTGVVDQDFHARKQLPDAVYLPQLFRNAGYFTASAGKIHHGGGVHMDPRSWDEHFGDQGTEVVEIDSQKNRGKSKDRTPRANPLKNDGAATHDGVSTRHIAGLLAERAGDGKPFFLALGLHKPHVNWTAPKKFFDLYPPEQMPRRDWLPTPGTPEIALETEWPKGTKAETQQTGIAAYFSCVSFTDSNVGQIMETVDKLDLWKSTIVIFMSDHGFHLGDRGLWSKKTLFEQTLRVPLIVALPDGANAGRTCRRTVQLLDIYPTLADLCGLTPPTDLEGRSLRPLLADPDAPWTHAAYSQTLHSGVTGRSVRNERFRYTEWDDCKQGVELYDHDFDPRETLNLADKAELAGVRVEMGKLLHARSATPTK